MCRFPLQLHHKPRLPHTHIAQLRPASRRGNQPPPSASPGHGPLAGMNGIWGPPMELDRRPPRGRDRVHRLQGVRGVSAGQHRALISGRTVGGPDGVLASGEDGTATSDSGRAGPPLHVLTTGPAWTGPSGKMRGSPPSPMWLKDAGGAGRSVGKEQNRPSQTRYQLLGPVLQLFRLSARDRRLLPPCGC